MEKELKFTYTNHRGETAWRRVQPMTVWHGVSGFHEGPQWFLKAYDLDKNVMRDFAMADITEVVRG